MPDITVILPTLNEERAVGKVIDGIKALPVKCDIVVVDGRSRDKTVGIAEAKGVRIIIEERKGKGIAVRTALSQIDTSYIVMIDADGTYPIREIVPIYKALLKYDVAKGHRSWCKKGAMTKTHKFGNYILSLLASILYGHRTRDVCAGLWGFRRECLARFNLTSMGFTLEADLFINTIKSGCTLKEFPINYKKRIEGDKAKLMFRDGLEIGWFLIKRRFS